MPGLLGPANRLAAASSRRPFSGRGGGREPGPGGRPERGSRAARVKGPAGPGLAGAVKTGTNPSHMQVLVLYGRTAKKSKLGANKSIHIKGDEAPCLSVSRSPRKPAAP